MLVGIAILSLWTGLASGQGPTAPSPSSDGTPQTSGLPQGSEATPSSEPARLSDRLMIRGGWAYLFGATANVSKGGPLLGVGTNVDFTNTLGGNSSTDAFRLDGLYRFNDRHAIGLSWYRAGLHGDKTLNQQIQIEDQIIGANATTQTSLTFDIWRLLYNYSFYHNDQVELGISPGLYVMKIKFNLAAQGAISINGGAPVAGSSTVITEQVTLPLPSVGVIANYNITPKLQFQSRFDFFYLTVNQYSGSMFETYLGLEYRLLKHFSMGAAYDRLIAGLKGSGDDGLDANFGYNLTYVYASLFFF